MMPFLIAGAQKSGTSTVCAVANTHPAVFCLYETDFTQAPEYGRNAELIALLPETASLFSRPAADVPVALEKVGAALAKRGHVFDFVGTKIAGLNADMFAAVGTPMLYIVRNVRFWGAKNRVVLDQVGKDPNANVAPILVNYMSNFVRSFLYPNIVRVRFEDLFMDMSVLPNAMARLLNLNPEPFSAWWTKTDWTKKAPKNYSSWIKGHRTAQLQPVVSDTQATLARHPFWDAVLPVFGKYYFSPNDVFPEAEVQTDLRALQDALNFSMTLNEGYSTISSQKMLSVSASADGSFVVEGGDKIEKSVNEPWRVS